MKVSLSRPQSKKIRSAMTSKKNSHTNSLIYKQINSQMEQLFSKSKYLNSQNQNHDKGLQKQDKNDKGSKKGSYINIKKKSQKVSISESRELSKLIINKLNNNFTAGLNSPVSQQQQIETQKQVAQIAQQKKGLVMRSSNPMTSIPIKSYPSQSQTPTLQKKSYTKTKIKLQTKMLANYKLERKLFCYDYIIGKGGFGKVWKVEHVKTRNQYAMKEMLKSIVITKKSVQSVINERLLLSQLNSPFLVNMHYSFQDRDTLYLVLDLMEGGDLRYHIGNRSFNQIQSKFFIACIILGLEHMHRSNIIHRDIKPQNLVLDSRGYIRITDLGIARTFRPQNSSDTSGTPGYMSPQVICRQNHSFVSDFFPLGVIAYELMTGKRPYNGRTRNQIRQNMLAKQAHIKSNQIPQDWNPQAGDFINRLLQRKPQNRLGFHGLQQIKNHPWIRTLNWQKLYTKQIESPFIPMMRKKNFDQDQQITIQDQQQAQLIQKNSLLLRKPEFQQLFKQYYFDQNENIQTAKQTKKNSVSHIQNQMININQKNQMMNSNQNKQVKTKLSIDKQKPCQSTKIGSKKYSQQLNLKKSLESQNKDKFHHYIHQDVNNKVSLNQIDKAIKMVDKKSLHNYSGIYLGHSAKEKRKNSTANTTKQTINKIFFKS